MSKNISAEEQKKQDRNAKEIMESIRQQLFGGHQFCRARFPLPILETNAAALVEHCGGDQYNARLTEDSINMVYASVRIYSRTLPAFFDVWRAVATRSNDPKVGKTLELDSGTGLWNWTLELDSGTGAPRMGAGYRPSWFAIRARLASRCGASWRRR